MTRCLEGLESRGLCKHRSTSVPRSKVMQRANLVRTLLFHPCAASGMARAGSCRAKLDPTAQIIAGIRSLIKTSAQQHGQPVLLIACCSFGTHSVAKTGQISDSLRLSCRSRLHPQMLICRSFALPLLLNLLDPHKSPKMHWVHATDLLVSALATGKFCALSSRFCT